MRNDLKFNRVLDLYIYSMRCVLKLIEVHAKRRHPVISGVNGRIKEFAAIC